MLKSLHRGPKGGSGPPGHPPPWIRYCICTTTPPPPLPNTPMGGIQRPKYGPLGVTNTPPIKKFCIKPGPISEDLWIGIYHGKNTIRREVFVWPGSLTRWVGRLDQGVHKVSGMPRSHLSSSPGPCSERTWRPRTPRSPGPQQTPAACLHVFIRSTNKNQPIASRPTTKSKADPHRTVLGHRGIKDETQTQTLTKYPKWSQTVTKWTHAAWHWRAMSCRLDHILDV